MQARDCKRMFEEGCSLDDVISELKTQGHSKVQSIFLLNKVCEKELSELKLAVHHSPAWLAEKLQDERFHDQLIEAATRED